MQDRRSSVRWRINQISDFKLEEDEDALELLDDEELRQLELEELIELEDDEDEELRQLDELEL